MSVPFAPAQRRHRRSAARYLTGRRNLGASEGSINGRTFLASNWTEKPIPWLPSIGILIEF